MNSSMFKWACRIAINWKHVVLSSRFDTSIVERDTRFLFDKILSDSVIQCLVTLIGERFVSLYRSFLCFRVFKTFNDTVWKIGKNNNEYSSMNNIILFFYQRIKFRIQCCSLSTFIEWLKQTSGSKRESSFREDTPWRVRAPFLALVQWRLCPARVARALLIVVSSAFSSFASVSLCRQARVDKIVCSETMSRGYRSVPSWRPWSCWCSWQKLISLVSTSRGVLAFLLLLFSLNERLLTRKENSESKGKRDLIMAETCSIVKETCRRRETWIAHWCLFDRLAVWKVMNLPDNQHPTTPTSRIWFSAHSWETKEWIILLLSKKPVRVERYLNMNFIWSVWHERFLSWKSSRPEEQLHSCDFKVYGTSLAFVIRSSLCVTCSL